MDGQRIDDGACLYYKLTNEPKGLGELKTKVSKDEINVPLPIFRFYTESTLILVRFLHV